jgi:hypothetical protein
VTEDPETIGLGLVLLEGGFDFQRSVFYPVSGLEGNLLRLPTLGVSFGISPTAELQLDGGCVQPALRQTRRPAPLSNLLDFTGDHTSDVEDLTIATKIRVAAEKPGRPAVGLRFATRLPNASNESGLARHDRLLCFDADRKTVQSSVVGNADPASWVSLRTATARTTRSHTASRSREQCRKGRDRRDQRPARDARRRSASGTESRGAFRVGGRVTRACASTARSSSA